MFHQEYWKDFLYRHEDKFSVYIHAKEDPKNDQPLFCTDYQRIPTVPTEWTYTMKAQIDLLKQALQDSHNNKFIFISETTIPLQSFDYAYNKLISDKNSRFRFYENPHLDPSIPAWYLPQRLVTGIPLSKQYKQSQWIVLNRKHAQLLIDNISYLNIPCSCDNELYPASILALYNLLDEVTQWDDTYVCWDKYGANGRRPFTFTHLHEKEEFHAISYACQQGLLFARKLDEECDLSLIDQFLRYRKKVT